MRRELTEKDVQIERLKANETAYLNELSELRDRLDQDMLGKEAVLAGQGRMADERFSSTHNTSDLITFESASTTLIVTPAVTAAVNICDESSNTEDESAVMESCCSTTMTTHRHHHQVIEEHSQSSTSIVIQRPLLDASDCDENDEYKLRYLQLRECNMSTANNRRLIILLDRFIL